MSIISVYSYILIIFFKEKNRQKPSNNHQTQLNNNQKNDFCFIPILLIISFKGKLLKYTVNIDKNAQDGPKFEWFVNGFCFIPISWSFPVDSNQKNNLSIVDQLFLSFFVIFWFIPIFWSFPLKGFLSTLLCLEIAALSTILDGLLVPIGSNRLESIGDGPKYRNKTKNVFYNMHVCENMKWLDVNWIQYTFL